MNVHQIPINSLLSIVVREREKLLFQGQALAITAVNEAGPFDVLPLHTNFISVVKDSLTIIKEDGSKLEIPLARGILKVQRNMVEVYLGFKGGD